MTKSIEEQAMEYATQLETNHRAVMSNHPTSYYVGVEVGFESGAKARDAQFLAVVNELRDALKKIGCDCGYDTIDGYGDSTCIPCEYTTKADQMLKEMGIKL